MQPDLLKPPVNVPRVSLHPAGLVPHIVNLEQWREHVLPRLETQVRMLADRVLAGIRRCRSIERRTARDPQRAPRGRGRSLSARHRGGTALVPGPTVFGTPIDITLSELAVEAFLAADAATAAALRAR